MYFQVLNMTFGSQKREKVFENETVRKHGKTRKTVKKEVSRVQIPQIQRHH